MHPTMWGTKKVSCLNQGRNILTKSSPVSGHMMICAPVGKKLCQNIPLLVCTNKPKLDLRASISCKVAISLSQLRFQYNAEIIEIRASKWSNYHCQNVSHIHGIK